MSDVQFRQRLSSGGLLMSTMLSKISDPGWYEVLADLPFDFLTIDMEHSPYTDREVADLIAVCKAGAMPTVVRIPRPQWHFVTRVFDSGASGVLAPYCESVDEVREVLQAARLKPLKGRLAEVAITSGKFSSGDSQQYLEESNNGNTVIIGIESTPAVDQLDEILEIDGIDAIFIGPADLSISMGLPRDFNHPEFERLVEQIVSKCASRNMAVAANFASLEQSAKWAARGINVIIHAADFRVLHEGYRQSLHQISAAFGQALDIAPSSNEI